jgi:hypothetical protein
MTSRHGANSGLQSFSGGLLRGVCFLALLLSGSLVVLGAKPTLDHFHPAAVARGTTNTVTFPGKFDPWPPKVWVNTIGLDFSFQTNNGRATLTVATDVEAGPKLLRLYNHDGASDPIVFVVSDPSLLTETEPNNHFRKPQALTNFPAEITGRLEKNNDVDSFAFPVKAGQWLDVRMESHVLMSKLDGILRLVTTNGYQLAWNHDFSSFDPRLIWRAPRDETVVLQAFGFVYPANAEIQLSGGNGGIYLLHLTLSETAPADLAIPLCEEIKTGAFPLEAFGSICPAGDEDKYPIELKKDDLIEARVNATRFGSSLDPWIVIRNAEDKELARNDDAEGSRDARLEWKTPADGKYSIVVGSLTHQGNEDWRYSLNIAKAGPDYLATISESAFVLESSATNDVKLTTKRLRGFTNELSVAFENLPEGVTAEPVKAEGNSSEIKLKIIAKDAPAFNGPVRIVLKDNVTSEEKTAGFEMVSRSENNGVPGGYSKLLVERTDQLWLTIKPKREAK